MGNLRILNWDPFESEDGGNKRISRYVEGYKCHDTDFLAFYIKDKRDLSLQLDFEDLYSNLENNYGIYFLISEPERHNGKKSIYVGKAAERKESSQNFRGMDRLREHIKINPDEKPKDKYYDEWDSAIFFTSRDNKWSAGVISTLEMLFIASFKADKNYISLNTSDGQDGNIKEKEITNKIIAINTMLSMDKFGYGLSYNSISNKLNDLDDRLSKLWIEALEDIKVEVKQNLTDQQNEDLKFANAIRLYDKFVETIENAKQYKFGDRSLILYSKIPEIYTPENIVSNMIDLLPAEMFNSKSRFLDISCKRGEFLLEILKRLMSDNPEYPINQEPEYTDKRKRLNHIISEQLFGVSVSKVSYQLANLELIEAINKYIEELNVYGVRKFKDSNYILPNIIFIDDYAARLKHDHSRVYEEINKKFKELHIKSDKSGEQMQFDIVLLNPPYNKDMYLDFVALGNTFASQYTLMITPAKWQAKGGEKNGAFRENIVPYISNIVYYPDTLEAFNVDSQGGISYYLIGKQISNTKQLKTICSVQPLFETNGIEETEITDILYNKCIRNIVDKVRLDKKLACTNDCTNHYRVAITNCYSEKNCTSKDGRAYVTISPYIQEHYNKKNEDTSFLASFDDLYGAKSYVSYLETKFIRFMFLMAKSSQHNNGGAAWRFVPDPGSFNKIYYEDKPMSGYTPNAQGKYLDSNGITHCSLYTKYNLTPDEINIIESVIKER